MGIKPLNSLQGSKLESYTPAWTAASTNPVVGNGSVVGKFEWISEDLIFLNILLTIGSTTTLGSGTWSFSLPTGLKGKDVRSILPGAVLDQDADWKLASGVIYPDATTFNVVVETNIFAASNIPHAWAAPDTLMLSGVISVTRA